MSGHVEGFFEAFVSLTISSSKGPFAYDGHKIAYFMAALEEALKKLEFDDPLPEFKGEKHEIRDAIVFHVGPTLSSLQYHLWEAGRGGPVGDVAQQPGREPSTAPRREWRRPGS